MSVEASALERSKLEQKDRTQLAAIVEAMGGKATSRAKKADLVDEILRLAHAPAGGAPAPAPASAPEARNGDAGSRDTTEDAVGAGEGDAHDVRAADDHTRHAGEAEDSNDSEDSDDVDDVDDIDDADEATGAAARPAFTGGNSPSGARDRAGGESRGGQSDSSRGANAARHDDAGSSGPQTATFGGQNRAGDGDGEGGNRRRRRRGRDRNRGGQDQQPQQQQPTGGEEPFLGEPVEVEGLLDLREEGYGFLRLRGYLPSKDDVYVSVKQVRQLGLRRGDHVKGASRPASRNEKNPALLRIDQVNEQDPEHARNRRRFEDLTPLFPEEKLPLERPEEPLNMTARIIDLISPIGKGQRGLIVSPPKAGKTTIMKEIARSIEVNNPEVHLIVLLVDERPEEVTDMRKWLQRGEVVASTFDRPSDEHTQVAELTIERAKRLVEEGRDVCIILDGITRLARAYNLAQPATGRIMSGGIDAGALYPPKKFFGAARNIEEGGSLTILATALVETNSRMDEHIFEEFKGTGNMELRLDRRLAERRIYPAIDVDASSTRHEELLFARNQLQQVWKLRRVLQGLGGGEGGSGGAGLELLIDRMRTFRSNDEFLSEIAKAPAGV